MRRLIGVCARNVAKREAQVLLVTGSARNSLSANPTRPAVVKAVQLLVASLVRSVCTLGSLHRLGRNRGASAAPDACVLLRVRPRITLEALPDVSFALDPPRPTGARM